MILSGRCAPATVSHDAAAPPRTQRDCRLLMPAPSVYIIVTARMSALVGLGGRTSASAECVQTFVREGSPLVKLRNSA